MKRKWFCLGTVFFVLMALAMVDPCPAQTMGDDIDIKPKTLGAGCKSGATFTATWDLPDGWGPGPVDIKITEIGGNIADIPYESYQFKRHRGDYHLLLKYSCEEVLNVIKKHNLGGEVLIVIEGYLYGDEHVTGWDDIHVRRR